MPDYAKGKIYCLRSYQTDDIYIGSTIETLSTRKAKHKSIFKRFLQGLGHYVTYFDIIKFDDCYIELIENYPCKDKAELERREGHFIREMECINKCIAGRTKKEWYKDNKELVLKRVADYRKANKERIADYRKANKEKHKQYNKDYYHNNKEVAHEYYQNRKEKLLEKIRCQCGSEVSSMNIKRHNTSQKHLAWLESQK